MKTTLVLLGAVFAVTSASAALIFEDTFNEYSAGNLPTGEKWAVSSNTGASITQIQVDSGDLFGEGASNKYLRLAQTSTAAAHPLATITDVSGATYSGQLNFDLVVPVGVSASGDGLLVRLGANDSNSGSAFGLSIQGNQIFALAGTSNPVSEPLATITLGQAYSLSIVYNNSSSAITYGASSSYSLDANSMDVWLDGTRIATGLAKVSGLLTDRAIDNINFVTKSNSVMDMYVDNLTLNTAISIPEPSTASLALGGLALLARFGVRRPSLR